MKLINRLTNAFPIWVLAASVISLIRPAVFTWFSGPWIPVGLGIIMLGMGLTLRLEDFTGVLKYPLWVLTGVILQYTVMPSLGWLIANVFQLPPHYAAGLILVACCPGGTASNVVSYLARANVPLSVTMTAITTLMAVVVTPLFTTILVGDRVEVNGWGLFWSTVQVVMIPIAAGILMNQFLPKVTRKMIPFSPLVAVIFITLIVASIVGGAKEEILYSSRKLVLAVFSLHALGFLLGYAVSRLVTRREIPARTISIEVGMQNSGLGVVLAQRNFTNPLAAVPCAISSVFHSVIASALAALWRLDAEKHEKRGQA